MRKKKIEIKVTPSPATRKINGALVLAAVIEGGTPGKPGLFGTPGALGTPALKRVRWTLPSEEAITPVRPYGLAHINAATYMISSPYMISFSASQPMNAVTISRDDAYKLMEQSERGQLYFVVVDNK